LVIMTEPNVDPTGQLQDLRHSKPIPIKKTLVIVNNYIVNTTRFLNRFSEIVDEKLIKVSTSLARLETTLSVLESKLGSVPGLDATEPPPIPEPVTTTTTTAPAAGGEAVAPAAAPAAAPAPEPAGTKVKDHPEYARYFKLLKLGMPIEQIKLKLSSETDLDPNMLETPDAMVPPSGAAPAAQAAAPPPSGDAPMQLENGDANNPEEPPEPAVMTVKEDPAFKKYFKMLAVGIPPPVVKHKMTMEGFDGSLLDTPNAPSPNAGALEIVAE
jgi:WASH complex subunit CCDC53